MSLYKKIVLLHSNDMHGDFLAEDIDDRLVGGVSMLSGYVDKVRKEEPANAQVIRRINYQEFKNRFKASLARL